MTTSPAYDALVARKLRELVPDAELIAVKLTVTTNSAATIGPGKRKGGWPKGKKRKAGK